METTQKRFTGWIGLRVAGNIEADLERGYSFVGGSGLTTRELFEKFSYDGMVYESDFDKIRVFKNGNVRLYNNGKLIERISAKKVDAFAWENDIAWHWLGYWECVEPGLSVNVEAVNHLYVEDKTAEEIIAMVLEEMEFDSIEQLRKFDPFQFDGDCFPDARLVAAIGNNNYILCDRDRLCSVMG